MRLIDADALMDSLDSLCDTVCQYSKAQRSVMCGACPLGGSFDVVDDASTVDAVEVVRCKDCIHHDDFIIGAEGSLLCWEDGTDRVVSAMGYCERGERRSDD